MLEERRIIEERRVRLRARFRGFAKKNHDKKTYVVQK